MDVGTAMSVAQTLFAALQCSQLKEFCSTAEYKSKLHELRLTVKRIETVLKDAEAKQELSEQERLFIEELKDAVYEADDLFDEFVTLAKRKQLTKGIRVRVLSLFTKFGTAYNMTQGVKKIKNKLDAIAFDKRFNLSIDPKPNKDRRLETCSYVYEADIIGREPDLKKIVGLLLESNVQQNVSFLSIVGIGGLGKTALSQLVYSDARVKTAFSLKLWICVADENQEELDVRGILDKILLATGHKMDEGSTMDMLQNQLRKTLAENKYLLVLDDVWTESREQWNRLTQYLVGGKKGSWIVVTTRSHLTANIIGDGRRHGLKGLSKEDSLCLFKRVAFGSQHSNPPEDLVKIAEDIVEECANVPLAIRVMGSLLYGQEKNKWLSIRKLGLAEVKSQTSIIPILKLSYFKLESPLKACFGYCAIFPKDYEMRKDTLIRLWMANGYIPFNDPQSPEDLAEEYFSILLRRCFFQDVRKGGDGNIISCKVHDLMHDVAQKVVGKEILLMKTMNEDVDNKVRHLAVQGKPLNYVFSNTHIRSYLRIGLGFSKQEHLCVDALVGNWKYLRAMDLSQSKIKSLPGSIGELIHLRYLDLSSNRNLEFLPESITKLYNLQTLELNWCGKLKELPKDLRKLVNLRVLEIYHCNALSYMPRGMGMLTCLHALHIFMVGGKSPSKNDVFDELEDLKALRNLKGGLTISVRFMKASAKTYKINRGREGGCLGNKEHLKKVELIFLSDEEAEGREEYDEAIMEMLQPLNSNLKELCVIGYQGVRMPRWPREDSLATFLPNLVKMYFHGCLNLQNLGHIRLPHLIRLIVEDCPNLTGILECPALGYLDLTNFNDRLEIIDIGSNFNKVIIDNLAWLESLPFQSGANKAIQKVESLGEAREVFSSHSSNMKNFACLSTLEELEITECSNSVLASVKQLPFCQSLRSLSFDYFFGMVELPNWISYLTSLQTLHIRCCEELESMPNWMPKLTSLRELKFVFYSARLEERCQESTGEDWSLIQHIPSIEFWSSD